MNRFIDLRALVHLSPFLACAEPTLYREEAQHIASHLSGCEECAKQLALSELHREMLFDALRDDGDGDEAVTAGIADTQREFAVWARQALERLNSDTVRRLRALAALGKVKRAELQNLSELDDATYRVALAVSEARLALQTLILHSNGGRATLHPTGSINVDGRTLPTEYLATRISEHAAVPPDIAAPLWTTIAQLTIDGKVGLPRIHAIDESEAGTLLVLGD